MQRFLGRFLKILALLALMVLFAATVFGVPILMIERGIDPVLSVVTGFILAAVWLVGIDIIVV